MAIEQKDLVFSCNHKGSPSSGSQNLSFSSTVKAAWWSPYDNIKDLAKVDNITLQAGGNTVTVSYRSAQEMITRIMVYADVGK